MRWRAIVGIVGGAMFVASAAAHSLLGWKGLGAELAAAGTPPDLLQSVRIGWHFGGACMLAFGVIALTLFVRWLRGGREPGWPVLLIGAAHFLFGAWAFAVTGNPFFTVFLVPGALLVAATAGR
jgi:hypothetical protein